MVLIAFIRLYGNFLCSISHGSPGGQEPCPGIPRTPTIGAARYIMSYRKVYASVLRIWLNDIFCTIIHPLGLICSCVHSCHFNGTALWEDWEDVVSL